MEYSEKLAVSRINKIAEHSHKILHLAAADHGGAGIAAWRIHDSLKRLGHQSKMIVLERKTPDPDVHQLKVSRFFYYRRLATKAWLKMTSRPDPHFQDQLFSAKPNANRLLQEIGMKPDIIVVHFISHFLNAHDVLELHTVSGAPVIWSLLDMGLLTGGCHYAWDCKGYQRKCGNCPALRIGNPLGDRSAQIMQAKIMDTEKTPGWVIAGSTLLQRQAKQSTLFKSREIHTSLLGVSPDLFRDLERPPLRAAFKISDSSSGVIFFGALKFNQRRKGMAPLFKALKLLANRWPKDRELPTLLCAGNASDFSSLRADGFPLVELGYVGPPTLAKAYACADVFACPSIEDSGPMMINESMMSGTPVVAFRMGVAEDLITPGQTGYIAKLGDEEDFARGLLQQLLMGADEKAAVRISCRDRALQLCETERQVQHFLAIATAMHHSLGSRP